MRKQNKAFSIRVDENLYNSIKEIAEREGRTLNAQVYQLLTKGLRRYKMEQRAIEKLEEEEIKSIDGDPDSSQTRKEAK